MPIALQKAMHKVKRLFLDTNVVLDLLQGREPFVADALYIFALAESGQLELALSTDSLITIFYVIEKNKDANTARGAISKLLDYVTLCSLDEGAVLKGIALDFIDIEDAFICSVALKSQASAILTRNTKDFAGSPLPVITPCEFVAAYKVQHNGTAGPGE